jgi:fatty acid elongase 3
MATESIVAPTTGDAPCFAWSLDRPFGFHLDAAFARVYELIFGSHPDQFKFVPGETWLSTNTAVVTTCIVYLSVIFGGQALMRQRKPIALPTLFKLHNLILSIGSGLLLLLFIEQLLGPILRNGPFWAVCAADAWTQRLELLYYINYLFKYYELLDTIFLVLKKKPLEFLHYYHHSLTMVLCYTQLVGRTSVSWVPITLNLTVHVVMYYYYFLASCGIRVWWKKYLTTMQIVQFILDLIVIYFCTYTYFAAAYWPYLPNMGTCAGTETAAFWGAFLISSYLVLFIKFYRDTYIKQKRGRDAVKAKKSQ